MRFHYVIVFYCIAIILGSCQDQHEFKYGGDQLTKSKYEYIMHRSGNGPEAKVGDYIEFTYEVIGGDSTVIQAAQDSLSYPLMQLPPLDDKVATNNPVVDLFYQAQVNDSFTLYMPYDSLKPKNPAFEAFGYLQYVISIKSIMDEAAYKKAEEKRKLAELERINRLQAMEGEIAQRVQDIYKLYRGNMIELQMTSSGLRYYIEEMGNGPVAKKGDMREVLYYGALTSDGSSFDNSYKKGKPIGVKVGTGMVIPGWDEALMTLPSGTKAFLFIPAGLAYGANERPNIPANSNLLFYVDIK